MPKRCKKKTICDHRKFRDRCIICSPLNFCDDHQTLLAKCALCYFKSWCRHGGKRIHCVYCRICVCSHGMNKKTCHICKQPQANSEIPRLATHAPQAPPMLQVPPIQQMQQMQQILPVLQAPPIQQMQQMLPVLQAPPIQQMQQILPVLQAPPMQPVPQEILPQGVTFGQNKFCIACPAPVQTVRSFMETQFLPPLVLIQIDSIIWKIQSGSIICLDNGSSVFFQCDGYCYQTNSLPHPPFFQTIQSTSLHNPLEKNDDDLESFFGLLPDNV